MASKRDIDAAVQKINAEEPTYLNLTITGGLNKVSELTLKAKEVIILPWLVWKVTNRSETTLALKLSDTSGCTAV